MTTFQTHVIDFEIEASLVLLHVRALLNCHSAAHIIGIGSLSTKADALIDTVGPLQPQGRHDAPTCLFPVEKPLRSKISTQQKLP